MLIDTNALLTRFFNMEVSKVFVDSEAWSLRQAKTTETLSGLPTGPTYLHRPLRRVNPVPTADGIWK